MTTKEYVPWDPAECNQYIVQIIGNEERFPEREPYTPGFMEILVRLMERYGEDYYKSFAHVLRDHLEDPDKGSPDEQAIWNSWRIIHANRVVSDLPQYCLSTALTRDLPQDSRWPFAVENKQRVMAWEDGGNLPPFTVFALSWLF